METIIKKLRYLKRTVRRNNERIIMIEFRPIELKDKEWIEKCLLEGNSPSCEYTFVNNFIWSKQYQLEIANFHGFYCSRSGKGEETFYSYPAGKGDMKYVIDCLKEDAKEHNIPFVLRGMIKEQVDYLNELYPNQFEIEANRDEAEYLYTVEKLSKLAGKKLHGKRNHIARFKDNDDWSFEEITEENFEECLKMNDEWCEQYDCIDDPSLNHELCAVKEAFANYKELGLIGGLIRREGKVIAYTIGSKINDETFDIHIEKAFANIQGAYPMINQQFVLHKCQEYQYINREEDLGDEGLRKAKMSYYPDILLEKYTARLL